MKLFNFLKKGANPFPPAEKTPVQKEVSTTNRDSPKKGKEKKFSPEKAEEPKVKLWRPRPINKEKIFPGDEIIVSKTDVRGNITYGNRIFIQMSGYPEDSLLGQPHSIIRHPAMPQLIFKALWDTISQGKEINAYVINMAKDGSFYWVFANVTPSFDEKMNIIGYYSVRRKPNLNALKIIKPFYESLKRAEAIGGTHESLKELERLLKSQKMGYEELVYYLQYNL